MRSLKRVFIANRGEIARRIAQGAQTQGIEVAALYSGSAPPAFLEGLVQHFILVADESPALYLNGALMVQLAQQSGCDAVHPGFGFLSENASFAQAVEAAGLIWIGPSPAAIAAVASKAAARELAKRQGVPVVPGIDRLTIEEGGSHLQVLRAFIREQGFPILLKAALGGGGKGMRIVRRDEDLAEAVQRAQSEAMNAFGDGNLIVERYVEHPRHVEVQILGDSQGQVYALGDRDCSVQRRHQKIIEEAPAPGLTAATRARMQAAAIRLAESVQYSSAGTVEFLLDWSPDRRELADQEFYFLEMNTRLQVEHPVTEEIFKEDLVAWQFRIAQGETIKDRLHLQPQGHSIELRLYAEDASQRFLPAPGPVYGFLPAQLPGIRWEVGIDSIDEISSRFDPMIAKLIGTGADRTQAIERLVQALKQTVLAIPVSNVGFLLSVLRHPAFARAQPSTRFIEDHQDELQNWIAAEREKWADLAIQLPPAKPQAWHASLEPPDIAELTQNIFLKQKPTQSSPEVLLSLTQTVEIPRRHPGSWSQLGRGLVASSNGWQNFCFCHAPIKGGRILWVAVEGQAYLQQTRPDDILSLTHGSSSNYPISAPVPGKVVKIMIQAGDAVQERQVVVILESMKMEFEVQASRAGTIAEVLVKAGQQVQADEQLAVWQSIPE